jgi:sulfatase maturation enzyme AslB (radical SAM superfamily)
MPPIHVDEDAEHEGEATAKTVAPAYPEVNLRSCDFCPDGCCDLDCSYCYHGPY